MLWLCKGFPQIRINLSVNHKYYPEHVARIAEQNKTWNFPVSLELDNNFYPLNSASEIELASKLISTYHNKFVCQFPDDDNYIEYEELEGTESE